MIVGAAPRTGAIGVELSRRRNDDDDDDGDDGIFRTDGLRFFATTFLRQHFRSSKMETGGVFVGGARVDSKTARASKPVCEFEVV